MPPLFHEKPYPFELEIELGSDGLSYELDRGGGTRWREDSRALVSLLRGSIQDSVDFLASKYPTSWREYSMRPVGLVEFVAEQHATLYTNEPEIRYRKADGTYLAGDELKLARELRRREGVSAAMQAACEEAVVAANGTVWLRPVVRTVDDRPTFVGLRAMSLPSHTQAVDLAEVPEGDEIEDVTRWWVVYPVPGSYDPAHGGPRNGIACVTRQGAVWERVYQAALEGASIWPVPGTAEGTPRGWIDDLPVVLLRRSKPKPGEFWARTRSTLLQQSRLVDFGSTDQGDVSHMQGHGQWVGEGMTPEGAAAIQFGPKRIACAPQGGKLEPKKAGADLGGMGATLESYVAMALGTNGLNTGAIFKGGSITALAKEVDLWDRDDRRQRLIDEATAAEQRLFDLRNKYYEAFTGAPVLPPCTLEVSYRRREAPRDPLHRMQESLWRIALGQSDPMAELRKLMPQSDDPKAAEEQIREHLESTRRVLGYIPKPPGVGGEEARPPDEQQPPATTDTVAPTIGGDS